MGGQIAYVCNNVRKLYLSAYNCDVRPIIPNVLKSDVKQKQKIN